jgi:hypothetical protein
MEIVKKIISPSKHYKAEIIKRNDELFHIEIYVWEEEWECWSRTTRNLSLIDTKEHAINIAIEELHNRTGENIIL